jgi:tripartite-type tricarboxylate transporter receptor subunit TctC
VLFRQVGSCVCAGLVAVALSTEAPAQGYPNGPVTLVVPFVAGGTVDQVGRALARGLEKKWGTPVIVENKPGAGMIIGATAVARAKPDGHKLLLNTTNVAINPILFKSLPYDTEKGLAAVTFLAHSPNVLVVRPRLGVKTLQEFIALAKKSVTPLQYASPGKGTAHHFCMELLQIEAGIKLTHITYKGVVPALKAVLTDEVEVYCSDMPGAVEPIRAGSFIPLAVTSAKRVAVAREVPTMVEAGLPKYDNTGFVGIMTTGGTPKAIVDAINRDIQVVIMEPEFQKRFSALGYDMLGGTPGEFTSFISREMQRYRDIAKAVGLEAE